MESDKGESISVVSGSTALTYPMSAPADGVGTVGGGGNEANAVVKDASEAAAAASVSAETIVELLGDIVDSHLSLETYASGDHVSLLFLRRLVRRAFEEVVQSRDGIISHSHNQSIEADAAKALATSSVLLKLQSDIQAFVDSLEELSGGDSVMPKLATHFLEHCLFGVRALACLVDTAAQLSWPVNIRTIYNPWELHCAQLHDWQEVMLRLEDRSRLLRRDEVANAADISVTEKALKALRVQYPEPPVFNRVDQAFKFSFHMMEDTFSDTPEGVTATTALPSINTNFGIVMGAPVCVKSIDAISLKRGAEAFKELVHMYTMRDKDAPPAHVTVPLQVHFDAEAQSVSMVFALSPLGNLSHVITAFVDQRTSERPLGQAFDTASASGVVPFAEMLRCDAKYSIASDVAKGLQYLHSRGIVHGSIKPSNVLIFDGHRAKLSDFGIAPYLKEAPKAGFWLIGGAKKTSINQFEVPEGALRWYAPELFLRESSGDAPGAVAVVGEDGALPEESTYTADVAGDIDMLSPSSDVFSVAMLLYLLVAEKKPYYNLLWNEAIYRSWEAGVRPSLPNVSYPGREEQLKPICTVMEQCWVAAPLSRPSAKTLSAAIEDRYKTFAYDFETRKLDELNKALAALEAERETNKTKLEASEKKAKSGDAAIEQKRKEFSEAYGNKQRQELQALIDKGSSRLVELRKDIAGMIEAGKRLDIDIKAAKNKVMAQKNVMRGGRDYILRHRVFKECTDSEALIAKYKQFVTDEELDAAIGAVTSANAAVAATASSTAGPSDISTSGSISVSSLGVARKGLLQKYIFECSNATRCFEDDVVEFELAAGEESIFASETFATDCAYAVSCINEHNIQATDVPRYAMSKFSLPSIAPSAAALGPGKLRRPSLGSGAGSNRSLV